MVICRSLVGIHSVRLPHKAIAGRGLYESNPMSSTDFTQLDDMIIFQVVIFENHLENGPVPDNSVVDCFDLRGYIIPVSTQDLSRVNYHVNLRRSRLDRFFSFPDLVFDRAVSMRKSNDGADADSRSDQ